MARGFNNVPESALADNLVGGNVGGVVSTRPQAKYASGARTVLRINGQIVGFAFGISWNISTSYREVESIDNIVPDELVPRRIHVTGSIAALHIPGFSVGKQMWQPNVLSFLFHQYLSIEVRDSATNELLFYAPKAVITTRQEEVRVDQLANVSLAFLAIGFRDEQDPTFPKDHNTVSSTKVRDLGDKEDYDQKTINNGSGLTST